MFTKAAASTTYPSTATAIGIVSSGSAATEKLFEAGIMIAYTPGNAKVRHRAINN